MSTRVTSITTMLKYSAVMHNFAATTATHLTANFQDMVKLVSNYSGFCCSKKWWSW